MKIVDLKKQALTKVRACGACYGISLVRGLKNQKNC